MQNALRIDQIYSENRFFLALKKHITFLSNQLSFQKEHVFLWTPVIFSLGIALYFLLPFEPPNTLVIFMLIFSIGAYCLAKTGRYKNAKRFSNQRQPSLE